MSQAHLRPPNRKSWQLLQIHAEIQEYFSEVPGFLDVLDTFFHPDSALEMYAVICVTL
jgi:hypothetical protein